MPTVTVIIWGNPVEAIQCVLTYVTTDINEANAILATRPWTTQAIAQAEAEAFAACVRDAGGTVTVV